MNDLISRMEVGARKENRRKILQSALVCFDTQGIEATSIDDIRQMSGASIGSIYHHFKSKEGLLAHLYSLALIDQSCRMKEGLEKAPSAREGVYFLVQDYMHWVEQNPKEAKLLFRGRHTAVREDSSGSIAKENQARFAFLVAWLKSHIASGQLKSFPTMVYPSLLVGQAENYCRSWLSGRVTKAPSEMCSQIALATWRSVDGENE